MTRTRAVLQIAHPAQRAHQGRHAHPGQRTHQGRHAHPGRRLPLVGVLVLAALALALAAQPTVAAAANCGGGACNGADPYVSGCAAGPTVAGAAPIVDGSGRQIGTLKLMFSAVCQTNWGQAEFNDGNPASTPPVTVSVTGTDASAATGAVSTAAAQYASGPISFTYTGSGSPVFGNMVYSPGCAYATVSRGDARALAVQVGCPAPGQPTTPQPQPQPHGGCSGAACDGNDPYASGCGANPSTVGSAPILQGGRQIGQLDLLYSAACQTNWGEALFNDGNPASTPPVEITALGTTSGLYGQGPVDFVFSGSGSPVWGNMVFSPGCAHVTMTRGDAQAQAVQQGCPAPGAQPATAGPNGTCPDSPGAGDNVTRWRPVVVCVLGLLRQPVTPALLNDVFLIIAGESSGNPNAINLTDSNARAGHPSRGLIQTIPETFEAHRNPALPDNIYDPAANIYAGLAYGIARYGSIPNIPGVRSVNSGGRYYGYSLSARSRALNCGSVRAAHVRLSVTARAITCRQARAVVTALGRGTALRHVEHQATGAVGRAFRVRAARVGFSCQGQRYTPADSARLNGTIFIADCLAGSRSVMVSAGPLAAGKNPARRNAKSPARRA